MDYDERHEARKANIELQSLRQKIQVLEARLNAEVDTRVNLQQLLHECYRNHYIDEEKASPSWLRAVKATFPIQESDLI